MRFKRIMPAMKFEWDPTKSDLNLTRRGFDFAFAAVVFAGPVIEAVDTRNNYGEVRIQAIGATGGLMLAVVYTDWDEVRRIISARIANRKERARWLSLFA